MAKNLEWWDDLTDHAVYISNPSNSEQMALTDQMWEWTQKLIDDGKVRAIDVGRIKSLIEIAYQIGQIVGRE